MPFSKMHGVNEMNCLITPRVEPAQWTSTTDSITSAHDTPRIRYEFLSDDFIYDVHQKITMCGKWHLSLEEPLDYLRSASKVYAAFIDNYEVFHEHQATRAIRLTCLFISIKYHSDEAYGMRIGKFTKFVNERTNHNFVKKKMCDLERFILNSLEYNLHPLMV